MDVLGVAMNAYAFSREFSIFFMFLLLLLFLGCGSKENEPGTRFSTTFVPTQQVPNADNTIFVVESSEPMPENILALDIMVHSLNGFVGRAKFNMDFFGSVIQYEDFNPGDFLGTEEEVDYQVTIPVNNPNRITVDITRVAGNGGVIGDGKLITIIFRVGGIGSSGIDFTDEQLFQPNGQVLNIGEWWGGTVVNSEV